MQKILSRYFKKIIFVLQTRTESVFSKFYKYHQITKMPKKVSTQTQAAVQTTEAKAQKKGRTLVSKLNAMFYNEMYKDMLGPSDGKITHPGVLAQAISDAGPMTPDQAETLLRGWLDQRFGKTHNLSGYMVFSSEKRAGVVTELGVNDVSQVGTRLGEMWRALSDEEKTNYNKKAKERNSTHALPDYAPVSRRKGSTSESEAEPEPEPEPEPVTPVKKTKETKPKTPKAPKKPAKKQESDDEISSDDD
jgi:hypothetical protein